MAHACPRNPDCYWVEPDALLAGEYPGNLEPGLARERVRALLDAGIRVFIDLTEDGEAGLRPYAPLLLEAADGHEVSHVRMSIPDVSVPSRSHMRAILRQIRESIAGGRPVYVHCWGGVGRTGTVVGCWLVEQGRSGEEALDAVRQLRAGCAKAARSSPETWAQERFVLGWARQGDSRERPSPAR